MANLTTISNRNDLVKFFDAFRAPARAILVSKTVVKMNKRDVATKTIPNPFAGIFKVQTALVEVNANYQGKVNNQRVIEGTRPDFESEELRWGKHLNGTIVKKDDQLYFKTIEIEKMQYHYELADGTKIDYSRFEAFMPKYSGSQKQELYEEVKVRTFKLESIIGVNIEGKVRYVELN
jgi:hypothetical protein